MRPLALAAALLALLAAPVGAAGKEPNAPVRVLWNSTPADMQVGGTWDARLSLLQGPGGFDPGRTRPTIVVTDLKSGAERRVPMTVDVPPSTFKASVAFPRAGGYAVSATNFDPRHPARTAAIDAPVSVAPGRKGGETWPYLLAAALSLALLVSSRLRGSAARRGRSAGCARSA